MQHNWLNQIHIVLIETTLPANIGSVARAMKTMGLSNLHIVNPKHPLDNDAYARASNAKDVLDSAVHHKTIDSALKDSHLILAASGRQRSLPIPFVSLRQSADMLSALFAPTEQQSQENLTNNQDVKIVILFGREDRGLTNEELSLANFHVFIPANNDYGVLNLAAAVQVFCYQYRQSMLEKAECAKDEPSKAEQTTHNNQLLIRTQWDEPPATHEQLTQLQDDVLTLAQKIGIFNPNNPRSTQKRLKRVLNRLQLDRMEYNFFKAILRKSIDKID